MVKRSSQNPKRGSCHECHDFGIAPKQARGVEKTGSPPFLDKIFHFNLTSRSLCLRKQGLAEKGAFFNILLSASFSDGVRIQTAFKQGVLPCRPL